MTDIAEFSQRLTEDWLVPFCRARGYTHGGFDGRGLVNLSAHDARNFMQAIDHGLVSHHGGFFTAPKSKAKEQIFWQGDKNSTPRKVTLWLEPIITIGALRRLQRDYRWPPNLLGLQSKSWAFDLVAYRTADSDSEYLVCEVKKSAKEVDSLINHIQNHLNSPANIERFLKGAERNAFKKAQALRTSNNEVFWALGPDNYGYVFNIKRGADNSVELQPTNEAKLEAPNNSFKPTPLRGAV